MNNNENSLLSENNSPITRDETTNKDLSLYFLMLTIPVIKEAKASIRTIDVNIRSIANQSISSVLALGGGGITKPRIFMAVNNRRTMHNPIDHLPCLVLGRSAYFISSPL
jgi:hypothetical protein